MLSTSLARGSLPLKDAFTARRIEFVSALLASVVGLATLVFMIVAPLGETGTCRSIHGVTRCSFHPTSTMLDRGISPVEAREAAAALVVILAVAVAGSLHSRYRLGVALVALWIAAIGLAGAMVVGAVSFGIFFFLPAILALTAAVAGSVRRD